LQLKSENRKAIGEDHYPENAYHTFYTLKILESLKISYGDINLIRDIIPINKVNIYGEETEKKEEKDIKEIEKIKEKLLEWSETYLAKQIAFHEADSSFKDSDQLAWFIAILTRFEEDFISFSPLRDLIKKGFECLFNAQKPDGSWVTGKPLFHFKNSGDAHCYMFETFSEIIKTALKEENDFLRQLLQMHYEKLKNMIDYAKSTCIYDKGTKGPLCLWSSGHRVNNPSAESWATASVYAFFQQMRRLIGYWTKHNVLNNLHKPNITIYSQEKSLENIKELGFVWSLNEKEIQPSEHLLTSFINPIAIKKDQKEEIEPDKYVISENQSRSAILFGPPGTCKTTLVKSIAGAIGWDYIEIHASDFLSEGLPNIHKKADEIFNQLMELDQAVILFDEIDELVRSREKEDGSDIYGRFLTTTMLPKIAQLWEQRKVIFFVATNFLENFDYAIIRGNRFDSLIYVPPPSFERKKRELMKILKKQYNLLSCKIIVTEEEINDIVEKIQANINETNIDNNDKNFEMIINKTNWSLVKFVLIRYDQLSSLAKQLYEGIHEKYRRIKDPYKKIDKELLETALNNIPDPGLKKALVIKRFIKEKNRTQRNCEHVTVWEVDKSNHPKNLKLKNSFINKEADKFERDVFVKKDNKYWYIPRYSEIDEKLLKKRKLEKKVDDKNVILKFLKS
jgi:SpoVK/Ycf46/Vps4 family AAA+-type ATPase